MNDSADDQSFKIREKIDRLISERDNLRERYKEVSERSFVDSFFKGNEHILTPAKWEMDKISNSHRVATKAISILLLELLQVDNSFRDHPSYKKYYDEIALIVQNR